MAVPTINGMTALVAMCIYVHVSITTCTDAEASVGLPSDLSLTPELPQDQAMTNATQQGSDQGYGSLMALLEPDATRQRVTNASVAPFSNIGFLQSSDGTLCTAALISRRHLLTAAHCVYDYDSTNAVRDPHPTFFPHLNIGASSDSMITNNGHNRVGIRIQLVSIHPKFLQMVPDHAFDLAVLELEVLKTIESDTEEWFRVGCFDTNNMTLLQDFLGPPTVDVKQNNGSSVIIVKSHPNETSLLNPNLEHQIQADEITVPLRLNIAGYPSDSPHLLYAAYCQNVDFQPKMPARLIQHNCDSFSGFSGGPMWVSVLTKTAREQRAICAVHKADASAGGARPLVTSLAVPLYDEALRFIAASIGN